MKNSSRTPRMTFFCWRRLGNYHLLRRKFCIMRLRFIYNGKFRFWNHADSENMQFTGKKKRFDSGKNWSKMQNSSRSENFLTQKQKGCKKDSKKKIQQTQTTPFGSPSQNTLRTHAQAFPHAHAYAYMPRTHTHMHKQYYIEPLLLQNRCMQ